MKVILLEHTPEPQMLAALAAKLCYSACDIEDLKGRLEDSDMDSFIEKIVGLGHASVLEHASFTFGVEGVSRALTHQLVRHRIASYSQQSQRYVRADELVYVVPPSIQGNPAALARYEGLMEEIESAYFLLTEMGLPKEDARYVLPNAAETKLLVTMNARVLLHFFSVRCCKRAQWEIREMASRMLDLVRPVAPTIFALAGPGCVRGACPEKSMGCGRSRG